MFNTVGGSPMMMPGMTPGMQRTPGMRQQRPATDGAAATEETGNQMAQRATAQKAPEPAGRASVEAKGMFVDCYA